MMRTIQKKKDLPKWQIRILQGYIFDRCAFFEVNKQQEDH